MIETIALWLGAAWLLYKFYKKEKLRLLGIAIFLLIFSLSRWPLFLDMRLSFSIILFFAAGMLIYDKYAKQKDKNILIYAGLFCTAGTVFLVDVVFKHLMQK